MDILKALGLKKAKPEALPQTVGQHMPHAGMYGNMVMPWTRWNTRKKLERDLVNMDENSIIVSGALNRTAEYATVFDEDEGMPLGFKVDTAEEDGQQPTAVQTQAVKIINDLIARVELNGHFAFDIIRDMVRKGDVFTETVLDPGNDEIAAVRQFTNSWQIEKNLDDSGNLKSGDPAVAMADPKKAYEAAYTQINDIGTPVAAFWPYQIVQWSFGHKSGGPYAEPVGAPGIKTYKRLDAGLDSLGVARIIRAWDTTVHVIPMPAGLSADEVAQKVEEYKQIMERDEITTYDTSSTSFQSTPRYSPVDVARDYYMPEFYTADGKVIAGDIKKLQPSTAALQHLEDLEIGINLLICNFGVPIEILGLDIGQKPMVDKTAPLGMEAFTKYLRRLQFSHAVSMKSIIDLELVLHGINPGQPLYKIVYPRTSPQTAEIDAKILMSKGQTATYYDQMMVPEELTGKKLLDFDANDVALWKAHIQRMESLGRIKGAVKPEPPPANPGEPNKPNKKGQQ